ncbi:MAG: flagellar basal body P-ring protein FlgI [Polyangiales bacterium]
MVSQSPTHLSSRLRSAIHAPACLRSFAQLTLALLWLAWTPGAAHATRVEDLCDIRGVRANQLVGYGLVVGLNRTGDFGQARFTVQSTAAMLRRLGATIDPRSIQTRNAAAVMITATLPPFTSPGSRIDVVVSSLGNARSLQGGTLVQTPLYGADRKVYAAAQGSLLLGGFAAGGRSGSSVSQNHVTAGRIPNGAIVERAIPMPGLRGQNVVFSLRDPNFVTAERIAAAINAKIGDGAATALSGGAVRVKVPDKYKDNRVGLISEVQQLDVESNSGAKVIIDERTGTVVLGAKVRISEAAIAQGGLTVEVSESVGVSQPAPLGEGQTTPVPETDVRARAAEGNVYHLKQSASLADVVAALNALGAKPRDMIAIFQALKAAGALQASLEVQ